MIFELFYSIVESILLFIGKMGYLGIFIGMTIESTFFPFPSEIILIPAGVLIAKGEFSFSLVLLASILGSVVGALINYFLALFIGRSAVDFLVEKYGKFFFINKRKLARSESLFNSHGEIATFTGRFIPGVRQLISIPAGFFRMKLSPFVFYTALGSGIWTCILLGLGYFFNEIPLAFWKENSYFFYALSFFICIIIITNYIILYYRRKKNLKSSNQQNIHGKSHEYLFP
ncbi:MAG: DedA family protein [Candidatus Woesearchaeota archaeon]